MSNFTDDLRENAMYDWYNDNDCWLMYMSDAHMVMTRHIEAVKETLDLMNNGEGYVAVRQVKELLDTMFGGELDESEGDDPWAT